jgi:hypothetical protein
MNTIAHPAPYIPLNVSHNTSKKNLQLPHTSLRSTDLPIVVLSQWNIPLLGGFNQTLSCSIVKPGIGRKTDILLLYHGININQCKLRYFDGSQLQTGFDGFSQKLCGSCFSDPVTPPGHGRRINGDTMLKELHAAYVLPIGILDPSGYHILITEIVGVLQVMKGYHHAGADWRPLLPSSWWGSCSRFPTCEKYWSLWAS